VLSSPDEERFPGEAQAGAQSADAVLVAYEPSLSDEEQAADAEQAACESSLSDAVRAADAEQAACEPSSSDEVRAADAVQAACEPSLSDEVRAADAEQAAYEPSLSDEVWDGPRSASSLCSRWCGLLLLCSPPLCSRSRELRPTCLRRLYSHSYESPVSYSRPPCSRALCNVPLLVGPPPPHDR
jgi:hypothetical protein